MKRTTIVAGSAIALLSTTFAFGAAASAAADQQGQADAAIAAFTEQVTGAGFESTGPGDPTQILDLRQSDDADPTVAAANACAADLAQFVADDGTFVGETARATSDDFALSPDAPASTDPFAIPQYDEISATVAFVDDPAGITQIIDAFSSGELVDCMMAAYSSLPPTSAGPLPDLSFDQQDLDLGDQAVQVDLTTSIDFNGEKLTFAVTIAMARVDGAIAIVSYSSNGEPVSDITAADALGTMVDALG